MPQKFLLSTRRNLLPFCVLFISLLVTVISWQTVQRFEQRKLENRFSQTAADYQRRLEQRLITYVHFLDGLGGLFSAGQSVSRQNFENYIDHINIVDNYPGMKRIGYLPLVPTQQKAIHEAQMRASGFTPKISTQSAH